MNGLPKSWDAGLEALLQAGSYQQLDVKWGDKVKDNIGNTTTFFEAINKRMPIGSIEKVHVSQEDPSRTRERFIRKMILAPLSPRKPCVIPCPAAAVKQRDKQKLEKIIRQRNCRSMIARCVDPLPAMKENQRVVRQSTIEKRVVSSIHPQHRTFYWGI